MDYFKERRPSYTEIGKIYFWTATINNWIPLLESKEFKTILIDSLSFLSNKQLIDVFGFVIMPNHIHMIWRMNSSNGNETPFGSFLKYTAHEFKKMLNENELQKLKSTQAIRGLSFGKEIQWPLSYTVLKWYIKNLITSMKIQ
ncbi:hypothetical protein [Ekhidna sp.]|uniref:hypothetical protein n=1 Tax=Ekhidna sp. TaxID=2608089 RepID=UPI003B507F4E